MKLYSLRNPIFTLVLSLLIFQNSHASVSTEKVLHWDFPLPRVHTGVVLGNGIQGLMVWGQDNQLNISIARAGFWDRRGGREFTQKVDFQELREILEDYDEERINEIFGNDSAFQRFSFRTRQIGGGRLELHFPTGWKLNAATLTLTNATLEITVSDENKTPHVLTLRQAIKDEVAVIDLPENLPIQTRLVASFDHEAVSEPLEYAEVDAPVKWGSSEDQSEGFCQYLPEDDPLALGYHRNGDQIALMTVLGEDAENTVKQSIEAIDFSEYEAERLEWWSQYWQDVPHLVIPDPMLQRVYDYGLFKQACVNPPHGVAATLQGPFMEEHKLPPWSNDYHFNINVQMMYLPSLASNRPDHFWPMWEMLMSWMPLLQENAKQFYGNENAIIMPHAVDDQGQIVGSFWTGIIDQACAAWMGQLAWQHYRYTMDERILEEIAYPIMVGAFEGYWSMLEEVQREDGQTILSLPVSVSPEFRGRSINAWGQNASFQLAALHMLCQNLTKAADLLEQEADPRWQEVTERVPHYAVIPFPHHQNPENIRYRIGLWDGLDLIESHRHHSHLAAVYPFNTIDIFSEEHEDIVLNSYRQWTIKGTGQWSGWCVPWASILHNRIGQTEAALAWLHYWHQNYVNEGGNTLHNVGYRGMSRIGSNDHHKLPFMAHNGEIMQLDAAFGALDAIHHFMVQQHQDVLHVLPEIPRDWKDYSFENIRVEGAFQISATVKDKQREYVQVHSLAGGSLTLAHNLGERVTVDGLLFQGEIITLNFEAGETKTIQPVD